MRRQRGNQPKYLMVIFAKIKKRECLLLLHIVHIWVHQCLTRVLIAFQWNLLVEAHLTKYEILSKL